jgi:hypothetical protein
MEHFALALLLLLTVIAGVFLLIGRDYDNMRGA